MVRIGPYQLDNPVFLAPMAGVTDHPFRQLCRQLGAGMVVSEMVTADTSLWHTRKSQWRLHATSEESQPRSVQIAGGDPQMLADAARANVELGAQIIDINMGCPAKKVCKKAAGSALLKDEPLVEAILRAVVAAVDVPVTLKFRTGWSPELRNGPRIAQIAQDCGIALLAVHGRTRACGYRGQAEYDTIAEIKSKVSIPVIANGDITSPQKARQVMDATGVDGVMIGRAAQGQPWLCGQIAHYLASGELLSPPDLATVNALLRAHLEALHAFYGDYMGVRIARKHVGWYLQAHPHTEPFRKSFNQLESAEAQAQALDELFHALIEQEEQAA